jgi:hypothetical protein
MQLLPMVNEVLVAHRADRADGVGCHCAAANRRACPTLGLAASALDLIIRCWRLVKSDQDGHLDHASRDLRAAVASRRLTDSEATALRQIIGVLDLAASITTAR